MAARTGAAEATGELWEPAKPHARRLARFAIDAPQAVFRITDHALKLRARRLLAAKAPPLCCTGLAELCVRALVAASARHHLECAIQAKEVCRG